MKTYEFGVSLCGGWCDGSLKVKADNDEEAYDVAMDIVFKRLTKAFPSLEIDFDVECDNPDPEEEWEEDEE